MKTKHICFVVRDVETKNEHPLFCVDGVQSIDTTEKGRMKHIVLGVNMNHVSLGVSKGLRRLVIESTIQDSSKN